MITFFNQRKRPFMKFFTLSLGIILLTFQAYAQNTCEHLDQYSWQGVKTKTWQREVDINGKQILSMTFTGPNLAKTKCETMFSPQANPNHTPKSVLFYLDTPAILTVSDEKGNVLQKVEFHYAIGGIEHHQMLSALLFKGTDWYFENEISYLTSTPKFSNSNLYTKNQKSLFYNDVVSTDTVVEDLGKLVPQQTTGILNMNVLDNFGLKYSLEYPFMEPDVASNKGYTVGNEVVEYVYSGNATNGDYLYNPPQTMKIVKVVPSGFYASVRSYLYGKDIIVYYAISQFPTLTRPVQCTTGAKEVCIGDEVKVRAIKSKKKYSGTVYFVGNDNSILVLLPKPQIRFGMPLLLVNADNVIAKIVYR
jgi:hypothetical protein